MPTWPGEGTLRQDNCILLDLSLVISNVLNTRNWLNIGLKLFDYYNLSFIQSIMCIDDCLVICMITTYNAYWCNLTTAFSRSIKYGGGGAIAIGNQHIYIYTFRWMGNLLVLLTFERYNKEALWSISHFFSLQKHWFTSA